MVQNPKVLIFDIETAPIKAYVWGLFDQNVGLNQIVDDWSVLGWSAKWLGDPEKKIMHQDQSKVKDIKNDKGIVTAIWKLLNQADIVITQNGKAFDIKKLNARFAIHDLGPVAPFKHIDTCEMAKKKFGFTSNKLEYLSSILCKKYRKLPHKKFPGFELWDQCLKGNKTAWAEMKKYNDYDVLSLEELYLAIRAWDKTINFNLYVDPDNLLCNCGGEYVRRGFTVLTSGKYQRYTCTDCGHWGRDSVNILPSVKRSRIIRPI